MGHEVPYDDDEMKRRPFALRVLRWLGFLLAGLVALILLALAGGRIYLSDRRITELVPKLLRDSFRGEIRARALHWRFPFTAEGEDVSVIDPYGTEVLGVRHLRATIDPTGLLHQRVSLSNVKIEGGRVALVPPPVGTSSAAFTIAEAFAPKKPSPPNPDAKPWSFSAGGLDAALDNLIYQPAGKTDRMELAPVHLVAERAGWDGGAEKIAVDEAALEALASKLELSGTVTGLGRTAVMQIDARGKAQLSLDDARVQTVLPAAGNAALSFEARGTLDRGTAKITLRGDQLSVAGVPVEALELDAKTDQSTAHVEELDLVFGSGAGALHAKGTAELGGNHRLEMKLENLAARRLAQAFTDPTALPERIEGTISAQGGSFAPLDTRVELDLSASGIPERLVLDEAHLRAAGRVMQDHALVDRLSLTGSGLDLALRGTVPFDQDGRLDAQIHLGHGAPNTALRRLHIPVRARSLLADLSARGTLRHPRAKGEINVHGLIAATAEPADVRVPFAFENGTVSIEKGLVELKQALVRVDGTARVLDRNNRPLRAPEIDARASTEHLSLGQVSKNRVEGSASVTARFQGTPQRYTADAELALGRVVIGGSTIAVSKISIHGNESELALAEVRLHPEQGGSLYLRGTASTKAKTFTAHVRGTGVPLAMAGELSGQDIPVEGTLSLSVGAQGSFTAPAVTGTVAADGLMVKELDLGAVRARLDGTPEHASAHISLLGKAGRIDGFADYLHAERSLTASISAAKIDIAQLPGIPTGGEDDQATFGGTMTVDLRADGPLPFPQVHGTVTLSNLLVGERKLSTGTVVVKLDSTGKGKSATTYHVDANALGALHVLAELKPKEAKEPGGLPFTGDARLDIKELSLADLLPALQERHLDVITSGSAHAVLGEGKTPIKGELNLPELHARLGEQTLDAARPIRLAYDGRTLALYDLELTGTTGTFHATGTLGELMDFVAKGRLNLAFIEPLLPQVSRATGALDIDFTARGKAGAPILTGGITLISPVTVRPRGMTRELDLDSGQVRFRPGLVELSSLKGGFGGGSFEASGEVQLEGFKPGRYRLAFEGTSLPLRTPDVYIEANAKLNASGEGLAASIRGDIEIIRGRYTKEFHLEQLNFIAGNDEEEPAEMPVWLNDVELDVHAASAGTVAVRVDAQALRLTTNLDIDVFIRGTAAKPRLDGHAVVQSGTIKFPVVEMRIDQGSINFVPTPNEGIRPIIDLTAIGSLPQRGDQNFPPEISMRLYGPVKSVQVDLQSDLPTADRAQLMAMLITGQTVDEILAGSPEQRSSGVDPRLTFVGSRLASLATSRLESFLEDSLNLQLNLQSELSPEHFKLMASRELSSRLRIEGGYERSLTTSAASTSASALVFLSSRFFVQGTARNVTGEAGTLLELEPGASGRIELKLRVLGH